MLLKHLDFSGIDCAVIFPPFACQVNNDMKRANLWAWEQSRRYPDRLLPAGTLFPLAPDAIEMLHICFEEGIRLVKIHPSIDLHDIADPNAAGFYAEAERLGITLDYHAAPHATRLSLTKWEKFDDMAWDFPSLNLVFEHLGGRTFFEEFLAIIVGHGARRKEEGKPPCVFGGLTSVFRNTWDNAMWYLAPGKIFELIKIVGADKLIYGLDFPWNDKEQSCRDIEILMELDISQEDKSKMLGGNLAVLLGIRIE